MTNLTEPKFVTYTKRVNKTQFCHGKHKLCIWQFDSESLTARGPRRSSRQSLSPFSSKLRTCICRIRLYNVAVASCTVLSVQTVAVVAVLVVSALEPCMSGFTLLSFCGLTPCVARRRLSLFLTRGAVTRQSQIDMHRIARRSRGTAIVD